MIIKTSDLSSAIYPFAPEDTTSEWLVGEYSILVANGRIFTPLAIDYWTPESFAQFTTAMTKAFELAGHQVEPVNSAIVEATKGE